MKKLVRIIITIAIIIAANKRKGIR